MCPARKECVWVLMVWCDLLQICLCVYWLVKMVQVPPFGSGWVIVSLLWSGWIMVDPKWFLVGLGRFLRVDCILVHTGVSV